MARTPGTDTRDNDNGSNKSHTDIGTSGNIERPDEHIEVISAAGFNDYAKELAFMEEVVEVEVHESGDPNNNEPVINVYVNGVGQMFERGKVQMVKRKYVQVLATAKPETMRTETMVQGNQVVNRIIKHQALRYPFTVREDSKEGRDWLKKVLQQRV